MTQPLGLELEAFIDVLGDSRSIAGFEQMHVAHRAFGCLAGAWRVLGRGRFGEKTYHLP